VCLPDPDSEQAVKLVDQLLTEFDSRASDTIVAYRGNYRWIPTIEPVRMNDSSKVSNRLRNEGVYLILGGLGGIGLVLAEHLAKTVKAKLILTGRKDFPAQDDWDQWLQMHDEDDETSQKIRKLLAIEAFGVEILVFSADVANLDQMQEVIKQAIAHFGQINGVIHAAGVFDGEGAILKRTRKATESVLASKVKGTLVLDEIFSDSELDFFILFSSIATELYHNMFGQVGYVAANSFLDAFAYCTTLRTRTSKITINWTDWQLVGMSVRAEKQLAKTYGINEPIFDPLDSILPTEGIDLFGRVLNNSFPRVIISTRDLGTRIKLDAQFSLTNLVTASLSTPSHSRPNLSNTYVAASNQLEKTIAEIWEELLGIEQVGIYDDYIELGGDSLRATQFIARLSETFQVEMPLQALFETPTIKGMAETIEALLWAAQGNMESSEQFGTDLVEGEI
jgi:NAD(P)-dependent dehydrogenase (short-subunit alcohol dehydrogenase family)/acyl carrier protein